MASFSIDEIAKHNSENDCWIIVENKVYDVTKFLSDHPGGKKILLKVGGQDATEHFHKFHNEAVLKSTAATYYIGDVVVADDTTGGKKKSKKNRSPHAFGDLIPYCDPSWYQEWHSPYYNETHRRVRDAMRTFVEKEIMPYVDEWDEAKHVPIEVYEKCAKAGFLPLAASAVWHEEYAGRNIVGGLKPEEVDAFHNLIMVDELSRCGSGGVVWGLIGGLGIGLPPVLHFGSSELKERVIPPVYAGKKVICLCITEPSGGSDVANLTTTARKTEDGKHYIVNGEKKWITNGTFADYFTVAVRTGGEGMMGVSMLLLERGMPGLKARPMRCSGMWGSGTAYVTFEDVLVPVENLIGEENQGFMSIMYNFNSERFGIISQANRFARVCYEEAFKYALRRKTFGKRLIDHQAIRAKLANMARQIEALQADLEYMTYQVTKMQQVEAITKLAGAMALLKAQSSQVFEFCAREAAQIFGGLSYTCGGQGGKVERLYREVRAYAIPGGSEEIMLDLGMKMAVKNSKL